MLRSFSLASNATATKFALAYKDFDIDGDYSINEVLPEFELTRRKWVSMCSGYRRQDKEADRDFKNNVCVNDFERYKELFKGGCYMCKEKFTSILQPTLDRIDCKKGHINDNVRPCCNICNTTRSDRDLDDVMGDIQLKKFNQKYILPKTIGAGMVSPEVAELVYHLLRNGITGGLANVMHRINIAGQTKINHFEIKDQKVVSKDSENVMTHVMGVDFNSLYPFSMGSVRRPWIQYDNGKMYMPASLIEYSSDPVRAKELLDLIMQTRFTEGDDDAENGTYRI
jgi:hypothetical protein